MKNSKLVADSQKNWKHLTTTVGDKPYFVNGINVRGKDAIRRTGEKVSLKDPIYRESHIMNIYELCDNHGKPTRIAMGEFSNDVWGVFIEKS